MQGTKSSVSSLDNLSKHAQQHCNSCVPHSLPPRFAVCEELVGVFWILAISALALALACVRALCGSCCTNSLVSNAPICCTSGSLRLRRIALYLCPCFCVFETRAACAMIKSSCVDFCLKLLVDVWPCRFRLSPLPKSRGVNCSTRAAAAPESSQNQFRLH